MNLDLAFVDAVIREGMPGLMHARATFGPDMIQGDGRIAYDFICDYADEYGAVPGMETVVNKTGVDPDPGPDPVDFYVKEILNRKLTQDLSQGTDKVTNFLSASKPLEALDYMSEVVFEARKTHASAQRAELMFGGNAAEEVWKYVERVAAGERGIPTPWPTINEITLGLWPEDLCTFVARTGIGKTWLTLFLMTCAWRAGKRVLYVTTEMSKMRIRMRAYAYHLKIPYGQIRAGTMNMYVKERLKKEMDLLKADDRLYIIGGNFDFRIESVGAAIDEVKPDILILDGIYLLITPGLTRTEKAANAFNEIKRLLKVKQIPGIVTTQFNREVKKEDTSTADVGSIALTDVAGWNSDLIFSLNQDQDLLNARQMEVEALKVRDGIGGKTLIWWDFETMTFDEIPKGAGGQYASKSDADEGSTFGAEASGPPTAAKSPPALSLVQPGPDIDEVPF